MTITLTENDFITDYDGMTTFPFFFDDEGSGAYGYGHIDRAEFVAGINSYNAYCGLPSYGYTGRDVAHTYYAAVPHGDEAGWKLVPTAKHSSLGVPVTVIVLR